MFSMDKKIEAFLIEKWYINTTGFEQKFLEKYQIDDEIGQKKK